MRVARRGGDGAIHTLADTAEIAGLGRGVDASRRLSREGIARAHAALGRCVELARGLGADEIVAVGTSALRDALNASDFVEPAAAMLGVRVEVISGEREAELTFRGACHGIGLCVSEVTTVDIGGGSTEITRGDPSTGRVAASVSLDVGSVRLHERHLASDPPADAELAALRADVDAALDRAAVTPAAPLMAIAGTATSIAAIARGIDPYDAQRVHGLRLAALEIATIADRLAALRLADRRKIPGLEPGRSDVIVAGAALLRRIVERFSIAEVVVSDGGVRVGLVLERFGV